MIIDFHTHVFSPRIKNNRDKYLDSDPCFALLYSSKKARIATADELIDTMDKEGIDISVIVNIGWTTHDLCIETNDYIMESVARYPGRLIGFCSVQPNSCEAALAEIERCAGAGIKGVGELRPDMQLFDLRDEMVMSPLCAVLQKHNMVLLIHASEPVGHDYTGKGVITPEVIYPFIEQFPDIVTVCAHWGGGLPFYELMPEVKQATRNVYYDTACSPYLYSPQIYRVAIDMVGADKILFGSDFPVLKPSRLLAEIEALGLSEGEKSAILAGNARRLLNIEK